MRETGIFTFVSNTPDLYSDQLKLLVYHHLKSLFLINYGISPKPGELDIKIQGYSVENIHDFYVFEIKVNYTTPALWPRK